MALKITEGSIAMLLERHKSLGMLNRKLSEKMTELPKNTQSILYCTVQPKRFSMLAPTKFPSIPFKMPEQNSKMQPSTIMLFSLGLDILMYLKLISEKCIVF